ncbi:hypothetical protein M3A49_31025 [Paraburkholderia sp. CNPSo 3076]|uniref:hypothetical protein n=1 Tax=Paraburkholderia sp. CNPSo 3076 TaxID=2940936 RepID=UPI0022509C1D|nr:hypothetical protein [Paraburkholderia sp. CNPSo 3076]MCX5543865.1 hypothetical protein [Paraburkholderia sp. CNPSo 3076]
MDSAPAQMSFDLQEVAQLKSVAVRGRTYANRVSLVLALRLLGQSGQHLDPSAVMLELDYLEGLRPTSRTKAEAPFKGQHLEPFWHKHFTSSRHVTTNIGIRWNLPGGGNKDLARMINDIAREHGDHPEQWINRFVHRLVVGGYEERAARGLTGDWIIYVKHADANYYLDLATHEEGSQDEAENLAQKLRKGCAWEFPFLFTE